MTVTYLFEYPVEHYLLLLDKTVAYTLHIWTVPEAGPTSGYTSHMVMMHSALLHSA